MWLMIKMRFSRKKNIELELEELENGLCDEVIDIKIKNKEFKEQVLEIIKNAKWEEIYPMTAASRLSQWKVYKYVEEKIKDIIKVRFYKDSYDNKNS